MSDADDAYAEARRLIAEAKASGATVLRLDTPKTRALTRIPPELSTLTSITTLDLNNTKVTDLSPLTQLTALTRLDLSGTQVTDLSPLTQRTALTTLDLSGTQVTDLAPLTELTALTKLDLMLTQVTDLAPLTHLTALTKLYLSATQVADLTPLTHLTALTRLFLSRTKVTDLAPLIQLSSLTSLGLWDTEVTDLAPLTQMTALTGLSLDNTQVTDPRPLITLTKLMTEPEDGGLTFTDTPFAALPEFAGIAEIEDPAERAQRLFAALEGWVPAGKVAAEQSTTGLRYDIGPNGAVGYARLPAPSDPTTQMRQLHTLLVEDAADLLVTLRAGGHSTFAPLARKLDRYALGLGPGLEGLSAIPVWKAGNDIRLLLRADADLKRLMVNEPTLDPLTLAALQGFVAAHNNFAALHPDLSALEHAQIDPAEAHKAEQDRALLQAAIDAFALQTRLIVEEVTLDLRDLHAEALGQNDAALRALRIEIDSIENLVKTLLAQATLEARNDTLVSRVVGDMRSAVVGAGVATTLPLAPAAATSFLQMIYVLNPQLADLLNTLQGQGGTLSQSVDYVVSRVRQALKK
jgi:Leucine-rich repeat (LRR) protein